jgi:uncharacterized protein YaaW (UPF0174 family)
MRGSKMGKNTKVFDKDLNPILEIATKEDLDVLVTLLKKKLSEMLTVQEAYKRHSPNHTFYADLIAAELREMGGHGFVSPFRGEGPSYHEIVRDVADKVKAPYHKDQPIEQIEQSILATVLEKAWQKMSEEEKEALRKEFGAKGVKIPAGGLGGAALLAVFAAGGFESYIILVTVANAVAKMVIGRGLAFGANAAMARIAGILAGPIGWAITGLWTALDLAGPAYSVTIPAVIHVAALRARMNSTVCQSCNTAFPTAGNFKFCPSCGSAM